RAHRRHCGSRDCGPRDLVHNAESVPRGARHVDDDHREPCRWHNDNRADDRREGHGHQCERARLGHDRRALTRSNERRNPGEPRAPRGLLFYAMNGERRKRIARWVAFGVDGLQIVIFPLFFPGSPWNNLLDLLTDAFMVAILGWHLAFLPTFVTEMIPFVDLFPTWTVAVLYVTRRRKGDERPGE